MVLVYRSTRVINFAVGSIGLIGATLLPLLVLDYGFPYWVASRRVCGVRHAVCRGRRVDRHPATVRGATGDRAGGDGGHRAARDRRRCLVPRSGGDGIPIPEADRRRVRRRRRPADHGNPARRVAGRVVARGRLDVGAPSNDVRSLGRSRSRQSVPGAAVERQSEADLDVRLDHRRTGLDDRDDPVVDPRWRGRRARRPRSDHVGSGDGRVRPRGHEVVLDGGRRRRRCSV